MITAIVILCILNAVLTGALAFLYYRHFTFEREVVKFAKVIKNEADTFMPKIFRTVAIAFLAAVVLKRLTETENDETDY